MPKKKVFPKLAANVQMMPVVDFFGPSYKQAFRHLILSVGNYGELYNHSTMQDYIPPFRTEYVESRYYSATVSLLSFYIK